MGEIWTHTCTGARHVKMKAETSRGRRGWPAAASGQDSSLEQALRHGLGGNRPRRTVILEF